MAVAKERNGIEKKMIAIMENERVKTITPIGARTRETREESQRIKQYDAVMSNINPIYKTGIGKSQVIITASAMIPLSCLYVDMRYQGMRSHKYLFRLYKNWDERKLGPIIVVAHPDEHRFAIVDGQGRYLISKIMEMESLSAIILMDAPEDPEERLKFEAEYFIGQGDETEIVTPVQKHLSRVIIGDETAMILENTLKKYGVSFVASGGKREESVLGSYPDTYRIAKIHGEKCLDYIFSIIENAGWNKENNGYATYVMRALKENWVVHQDYRLAIHSFLSTYLRQTTPSLLNASARAKYPNRDHRTACVLYIEDIVCEKLNIKRKIYVEDKNSICR